MNKTKHLFTCILTVLFICLSVVKVHPASATTISSDEHDKPIDLVIVMDKSGSMLSSDPERMTSAAVNMLINMMPAEGSRVAVVAFNDEPEIVTTVGTDTHLIPLIDVGNVLAVKEQVRNVVYYGNTGIGNALITATDILATESDDTHQRVIMLFTDGVNDFGDDEAALANCEDNEASAVLWAKNNDCPIYCFGYDYLMSDGTSSMGENGEGFLKLSNISEMTGGQATRIVDINTVQDEFIQMLVDLCDLIYVDVATVPGDGGTHEVTFEVGPAVLEANIRIGSITANAISNGSFRLYDPDGNEVELLNDESTRYDVDYLAASIKIIRPQIGTWVLELDGIIGDDIKIGLLEHYRVSVGADLFLPDGNPEGIAFTNDEILVSAWLNEDDVRNEDEALYNTVTNASATYVPRAHPDNVQTIVLQRNGYTFEGSFVIEEECIYDVLVRIESGTFYRETNLTIESNNHPLELVADINSIDVDLNKSFVVEDLYSYVYDQENDGITATVTMVGNSDAVNVYVDGANLVIEANQWKSTYATVSFRDDQGNVVETSFEIKVHNPWFWFWLVFSVVMMVLVFLLIVALAYRASKRIKGYMTLMSLSRIDLSNDGEVVEDIYQNPQESNDFDDMGDVEGRDFICKLNLYTVFGRDKNLFSLIKKICREYEHYLADNNPEISDEKDNPITNCLETYFRELSGFKVDGTVGGLKGFIIKLPKNSNVYLYSYKNHKGKIVINSWPKDIRIIAPVQSDDENKYAYEIKLRYTK